MKFVTTIKCVLTAACLTGSSAWSGMAPPHGDDGTLSKRVSKCQHFFLVERVKGVVKGPDRPASTTYKVIDVAKSKGERFKIGDEIKTDGYFQGKRGVRYSLMTPNANRGWYHPGEVDDTFWQYLKHLPPPTEDPEKAVERASLFISWLEHDEAVIAQDAHKELSSLPYESLREIARQIPRDKLRKWIKERRFKGLHLSFYSLCLGIVGESQDADLLKRIVLELGPQDTYRMGIEGVMTGLVMLHGEEALDFLDHDRLLAATYKTSAGKEHKVPFAELYAVIQTLRFLWTYEPDVIPQERLKKSMRILLDRPELADLVIADLTRWADWSIQAELMKMYDDKEFDIPSVKRAIIRFLYRCSKTAPVGSDEAIFAEKHLQALKEKDPKTHKQVMRFLVP